MAALGQAIREASRRRVFRGGAIYVFAAWASLRAVEALSPAHDPIRRLALILAIGLFPLALLFSWAFRVVAGGVHREHYGDEPPPRTVLGRAIDVAAIAGLVVVVAGEATRYALLSS